MVNGFMSYNASRLSGWAGLECMLRYGVMFVVTLPEKRGVSNVILVVVAVWFRLVVLYSEFATFVLVCF